MEILQEIGSYAGLAAILGLAVLSTLYFSQARDVKRLREWAGRAPERTVPTPVVQPKRIVAQPIPKPAQPVQPGGVKPVPPPVPRPPGAQPATPGAAAAASAAGAAPAVATGPAAVTPAAKAAAAAGAAEAGTEQDAPSEGAEEELRPSGEATPADGDADDTVEDALPTTGEDAESAEDANDANADAADAADGPSEEDAPAPGVVERPAERADQETGEWSPEDEHSDFELDERTRPHAAPKVAPPTPPRPYRPPPRTPAAARTASPRRADSEPLIPPYEQSRPKADPPSRGGRRPLVLVAAVLAGLAVVAFGVMQLTGGDSEPTTEIPVNVTSGDDADTAEPREAVDPSTVTVAVLNGTTVPGLAATIGDTIETEGFQIGTVTNDFDQQRAESVVRYAPGAEREAAEVARRLDIAQREAIDPDTQSLAGDASVVVVAGADQNR